MLYVKLHSLLELGTLVMILSLSLPLCTFYKCMCRDLRLLIETIYLEANPMMIHMNGVMIVQTQILSCEVIKQLLSQLH